MLVIFDCDGVLVDSEPLSNAALAESLDEIGLALTVEETTEHFMGRSWKSCLAIIEGMLGHAPPASLKAAYVARRDEAFRRALRPVPGIEDALAALDGTPRCVASSGDVPKMRLTLGMTGLLDHFDGRLFSATQVERGKPAPDLFEHAAAEMGFAPRDCVVVEDSPLGVEAARAAGMRVLGFAGRTPPERLGDADHVFDRMAGLPALL